MPRIGIGGIALTGEDVAIEADGLSLPVHYYRPAAASGKLPAVVICPGGIGTGMFEVMEWIGAAIRDAGLAAVTTSWRASSPEHDPDDVSHVIDWLERQSEIDADRLAVFGISRGGNAALRAAALDPRLKLAVTFGPATHLLQQVEGTAVYAPSRHRLLVDWLGDPVADRAFYEKVEAISYADRIRQPVLMVHGQHDMHTPVEQSLWMKEAMEAAGHRDVELQIVPMMGHYGDVVPNSYGFDTLKAIILPFLERRFAGVSA